MTQEGAEKTVVTSAVIVAGVYAFRKLTEGDGQAAPHLGTSTAAKQLAGVGSVPPLSHWIVGYGFAFMVISAVAQANPDAGGSFALLVLLGTVLAQGQRLADDLNKLMGNEATPLVKGTSSTTATVQTVSNVPSAVNSLTPGFVTGHASVPSTDAGAVSGAVHAVAIGSSILTPFGG